MVFHGHKCPAMPLGYRAAQAAMRALGVERAEDKELHGHCCKVSDEAAFCLIQRPYISKTLLTRRISPRGSP
ncbi:FmdE family protein [Klebsiella pneumoniae]|uniref:FmdE family protein n=1 Tax=Klebsiella pneumoniae TaxID=573 RepID=UPI003CCD2969